MGFRYELKTRDGDDADGGTFESSRCDWQPGEVFIGQRNTRWRIVSIVPLPLLEEFVDNPRTDYGRSNRFDPV
jgi:hypothetical protein